MNYWSEIAGNFQPIVFRNFEVIEEGSASLGEPKVVFIGEKGGNQNQILKISFLIQSLYREGDIVFVEDLQRSPYRFDFLGKKIDVREWNCDNFECKIEWKKSMALALSHIETVRTFGWMRSPNWKKHATTLFDYFPPTIAAHENKFSLFRSYLTNFIQDSSSERQRLIWFNMLVSSLRDRWSIFLEEQKLNAFAQHSKWIVNAAFLSTSPSSRVFLLGKIEHFTTNEDVLFRSYPQSWYERTAALFRKHCAQSVEALHLSCAHRNFVVLSPNSEEKDLVVIQKELAPSLSTIFSTFLSENSYMNIASSVLGLPFFCYRTVWQRIGEFLTTKTFFHDESLDSLVQKLSAATCQQTVVATIF